MNVLRCLWNTEGCGSAAIPVQAPEHACAGDDDIYGLGCG